MDKHKTNCFKINLYREYFTIKNKKIDYLDYIDKKYNPCDNNFKLVLKNETIISDFNNCEKCKKTLDNIPMIKYFKRIKRHDM